jgi:hypothetical protein
MQTEDDKPPQEVTLMLFSHCLLILKRTKNIKKSKKIGYQVVESSLLPVVKVLEIDQNSFQIFYGSSLKCNKYIAEDNKDMLNFTRLLKHAVLMQQYSKKNPNSKQSVSIKDIIGSVKLTETYSPALLSVPFSENPPDSQQSVSINDINGSTNVVKLIDASSPPLFTEKCNFTDIYYHFFNSEDWDTFVLSLLT